MSLAAAALAVGPPGPASVRSRGGLPGPASGGAPRGAVPGPANGGR